MPATQTRNLPYFQRACLLVSDLDKALNVYQGLLGFTCTKLSVDDPDSYSYEIFNIPRDIQTRFATLSSHDQVRTLALIEVPGAKIQSGSMLTAATVINVPDVAKMLEDAAQMGLKALGIRDHPVTESGPGRKEAAFYDHDGHPVVIFEVTP